MEEYLIVAMILAVFMIVAAGVGYFAIREIYARRYAEDQDEIRTKNVVEEILYEMLQNESVTRRRFDIIQKRIGGMPDDEIRKILLRLGAVRFIGGRTGEEYWGLVERNRDAFLTDVEKRIKAGEKVLVPDPDEESSSIVIRIQQSDKPQKIEKQDEADKVKPMAPDFGEVLSIVQDTTLFEEDLPEGNDNDVDAQKKAEHITDKAAE